MKHISALSLVILISACAHTTPVVIQPAAPEAASALEKECFAGEDPAPCLEGLYQGTTEQDARLVGQILARMAGMEPQDSSRAVLEAGLWLNPKPWDSAEQPRLSGVGKGTTVPPRPGPETSVLIFRTAEAGKISVPGSFPSLEVPLRIPEGSGPLAGDNLAGILASAAGARVAVWAPPQGEPRVVPATPILTTLLGHQLSGPLTTLATAVLLADADRSLRRGLRIQALRLLTQAAQSLPQGLEPCSFQGSLLFLKGYVAQLVSGSGETQGWKQLREICLDVEVSEQERGHQLWLGLSVPGSGTDGNSPTVTSAILAPGQMTEERLRLVEQAEKELPATRSRLLGLIREWVRNEELKGETRDPGAEGDLAATTAGLLLELRGSGRNDLAMFAELAELTRQPRLEPDRVAWLLEELTRPQNLWFRSQAVFQLLTMGTMARTWQEPLTTIPLCRVYMEDLLAEVEQDDLEDFNSRNSSRLVAAFSAAAACVNRTGVEKLTRLTTERAVSQGGTALLSTLSGVLGQLITAMLEGRTGAIAPMLRDLALSMDKVRQGLYQSEKPEDRAAGGLLQVSHGVLAMILGSAPVCRDDLVEALGVFTTLASSPQASDAPDLVRLAPIFRSGTLSLLAALTILTDQADQTEIYLKELDAHIQGDMAALFAYLEAPDISEQVLSLARAAFSMVELDPWTRGEALDSTLKLLDAAGTPRPGEEGWWALGLDGARIIIWDVLAAMAFANLDNETGALAFSRGRDISLRAIDRSFEQFELHGTPWEVLRVIPDLHDRIPGLLAMPEDQRPELMPLIFEWLREPLGQIFTQLRASFSGQDQAGVGTMLMDIFDMVATLGLDNIEQLADKGFSTDILVTRAADLLEKGLPNYPARLRFYLETMMGLLLVSNDQPRSEAMFARAEQDAAEAGLGELSYVPRLYQAKALHSLPDRLEQSQALVTELVERSRGAAGPGARFHPLASLLPVKAWGLERLGRHQEALTSWREYRNLVRQGFSGDAAIVCSLQSTRSSIILSGNITSTVSSGFFSLGEEGAFNVGAGYQGEAEDKDVLNCSVTVFPEIQAHRVLAAHLAMAAWSFQAGDPKGAQEAMIEALEVMLLLANRATPSNSPARVGALDSAMDKLPIRLAADVVFLATINGHLSMGDQLANLLNQLVNQGELNLVERLTRDGEGPDAPCPSYLTGMKELCSLDSLVLEWNKAQGAEGMVAIIKRLLKSPKPLFSSWGLRFNQARLTGYPQDPSGLATWDKLMEELAGESGGVTRAWGLITRMTLDPETVTLDQLGKSAEALIAAGFQGEAMGTTTVALDFMLNNQLNQHARYLADRLRANPDLDQGSLMSKNLLQYLLTLADLEGNPEGLLAIGEEILEKSAGLIPIERELVIRDILIKILGSQDQGERMNRHLEALLPILERSHGKDSAHFLNYLCARVAWLMQQADLDREIFTELAAQAETVQGAETTAKFLKLASEHPDQQARLGKAYLDHLFHEKDFPQALAP